MRAVVFGGLYGVPLCRQSAYHAAQMLLEWKEMGKGNLKPEPYGFGLPLTSAFPP